MLLTKTLRIEEMIVLVLAETPHQSVKQLHDLVSTRFEPVSLQAIYQELNKLEAAGVLLRNNRCYSLALHWVLELSAFCDSLYDRYTEPDVVGPLPQEGETSDWQFQTIASLVQVWTHFVLAMTQDSAERVCYEYMDHVLFHLCNSTVEEKFLRAMRGLGVKHYLAVGADSFLDRRYSNEVTSEALVLRYGSKVFRSSSVHYLSCIGPYVLRIKPKKSFLPEIDSFFERFKSAKDLHSGQIAEFINRRSSFALSIQHDLAEALKVKKAFGNYFVD